ncbi:Cytochrome P450 2B4 [Hypsibius exemplaris]|uniref:Cytochrome P450 2B4 n=1 Tax=Hypsibius exemplaris TaxID=2072580 RepID=A0A1W0WH02_HYPEX|nr:Cytochrome P450 2B4 [Hypsibius exemplaris]
MGISCEFFSLKFLVTALVIGAAALLGSFPSYFRRMWERYRGRLPPGPTAFPFVGTISVDRKHPDRTFKLWAKRYGSLFSFYFGSRFCVGVSDMNLVKRIFKDDRFDGRSRAGIMPLLINGELTNGIILGTGNVWKEHRKFTLATLKDFGFGKASGLEDIEKEVDSLVTAFRNTNGKLFNPKPLFTAAVALVVSRFLFSVKCDPDDGLFKQFVSNVNKNMQDFVGVLEVFPWLRHFPPFRGIFRRLHDRVRQNSDILAELVRQHRLTRIPQSSRDYTDSYMDVQDANKAATGSEGTFTDTKLVRNISDIFVAGYETTSTFLRWCVLYMILHPDVQAKIQDEIDTVVGQSRQATFVDKHKMPYTEAVVTEIHRVACITPFGLQHIATEDVELEGYTIPKGTEVWGLNCNHYSNPDVWKDPENFRPERFLDSSGCLITSLIDEVQPFSVGRRVCLGEPLARIEIFCFFVAILQNFNLTSDKVPSTVPVTSQVLAPQTFNVIATPRF